MYEKVSELFCSIHHEKATEHENFGHVKPCEKFQPSDLNEPLIDSRYLLEIVKLFTCVWEHPFVNVVLKEQVHFWKHLQSNWIIS